MKNVSDILQSALTRLLRPLARILLRHNISYLTFSDISKRVFIEVAESEFLPEGRKQSLSRVAMLTGLSRKEVLRVKRLSIPDDGEAIAQQGRSIRVINGWTHDLRFQDDNGNPRVLDFDNNEASFSDLVRFHSGDIPPRAVLDELLRIGLVKLLPDGRVRLVSTVYVPQEGIVEKISILGVETADLLNTIDHNIHAEDVDPFFQRKVCYFRFPQRYLPELRELSRMKSQTVLDDLNRWMAQHDDAGPEESGDSVKRVGLSLYYFEGPVENDHEQSEN